MELKFNVNLGNKEFVNASTKDAIKCVRARNALLRRGYTTIGMIVEKFDSPVKIQSFKGIGPQAAAEVFRDIFELYVNLLNDEQYEAYIKELSELNSADVMQKIMQKSAS